MIATRTRRPFAEGLFVPPAAAEAERRGLLRFRAALEAVRRDEVSLTEARSILDRIAGMGQAANRNSAPKGGAR